MLAHQTQKNLSNAREYFREHLQAGDYYSAGQRIRGQWFGAAAERLGLSGDASEDEFLRLCNNEHPRTGEKLTVRMKKSVRRIFEDFVFSPPKSVSLAAFLLRDKRVVPAHRAAVEEALRELEQLAGCRVRKGQDAGKDRHTGNIIAVRFDHETSRLLDPQLHTHCIVFNATWDETERRWKALQNYAILRERRFLTEVYRNRLAAELHRLGYDLGHTRDGFEIRGISAELCERFSKRREQIEEISANIAAGKEGVNIHDIRDHVAHRVRDWKIKDIDPRALRKLWEQQLSEEDKRALAGVKPNPGNRSPRADEATAAEALAWSIEHVFERKSAAQERELFAEALIYRRGQIDLRKLRQAMGNHALLRMANGDVSTQVILEKEWEIVCMARNGKGASAPLNPSYQIAEDSTLTAEQKAAVTYLLSRPDEVMIFRGGAGTGKSFTLQELNRGLDGTQHKVVVLAPQRKQVMALQADGFAQAETVASFLERMRLAPGCVVIVDEAGLLSVQDMHALMLMVRTRDSALILSGDTRQHSGVEAGDALRAIEQYSGIGWVSLESIQRQKEWAMRRQYRQAVQAISEGRIEEGFRRIARAAAIVEQPTEERYKALAEDYLALHANNRTCLVVSPTWREINVVTDSIRAGLISRKLLGTGGTEIQALENLDLTNAQKTGGSQHFEPDCQLIFHRKCGDISRNAVLRYLRHEGANIVAADEGNLTHVIAPEPEHFSVMRKRTLELRSGEWLLIQANGESTDGRKVANGELVRVAQIQKRGAIELADGRTIPANFRQFTYGYAVTSQASQGLTVDHVLLAIDSQSGPAVNRKQFYVSSSRGREGLRIYTDDAEALEQQITRSGHRPLALEVVEAARKLRIDPQIAARIAGKVPSVTNAVSRLVAWRAQCAKQLAQRQSLHIDLWQ